MRCTLVFLSLLMLVPGWLQADELQPGTQTARELVVKNSSGEETTLRYLLFVPANYDEQDSWPLMLFLHGAGERGTDLEQVKKWGPPRIVQEKKDFPFVVISPQCPEGTWWQVELLPQLVDQVADELKIDKSRMYATGLSMGGFGTWRMIADYPNLFAAAVPICGGGDPKLAEKIKIPVWAFHGDQDEVVPLERSQQMVDAVQQAGGEAKLTVYPDVGHNSWSPTYENQEVYDWLLQHKRKS